MLFYAGNKNLAHRSIPTRFSPKMKVSGPYYYVRIQRLTISPGGRYTPFMSNYRPQLFLRTADITVSLTFPDGTPDAAEKMVGFSSNRVKKFPFNTEIIFRLCQVTMLRWCAIFISMLLQKLVLGECLSVFSSASNLWS